MNMYLLPLLLLQSAATPPPERGTALPPPGTEEAAVMAPIDRMLGALATHDAPTILAQAARPEAAATGVVIAPDGTSTTRRRTFAEFAAMVAKSTDRVEERQFRPAIEIDGDMAMVWAPYIFLIDGKRNHCGTNHYSLTRAEGRWRIESVTWTQRTTECPEP
ncbi:MULTISPECIES: hypothetical protein [unclassified Sphingomonas]|uniref:hypothetical protein n=1 Tax=unclassified Sphingomonas TaxID=196159 RepID=UPI000829E65A|nr:MULTISPECIES: hypothetical protein [unclassified Sphingomonas]